METCTTSTFTIIEIVTGKHYYYYYQCSPRPQPYFTKVLTAFSRETLFKKKNSVALVREQTIPTERPLPVGEVSANFCG